MVPRLIFAALVFCSLASRPETAARHRAPAEPRAAPPSARATLGPAAPGAPP